jgi:hypothetical protein
VTWPAGSTSQSYNIDPTNPGNDITISMTSSSGNQFASGYPAIATGFGGSTTTPDLRERIQLTSASQFVTTTITFNYTQGVYVQNLNLLDIDTSAGPTGWTDQIRNIKGTTASGQTVNPVAVVGASLVTVTGNATTGWTATGNGTANGGAGGNLSISFGNYRITKITWDYGSGSTQFGNTQSTLLANITYSLTPEIHPALAGTILCGILLISNLWQECPLKRRSSSISEVASGTHPFAE